MFTLASIYVRVRAGIMDDEEADAKYALCTDIILQVHNYIKSVKLPEGLQWEFDSSELPTKMTRKVE